MPGRLTVCRLEADAAIPIWASAGPFFSITRTAVELSIVCAEELVPESVRAEVGWRALEVAGPLDFALTGILAAIVGPLAEAGISIFAVSTFDTDYVLVKEEMLSQALEVLRAAGHQAE